MENFNTEEELSDDEIHFGKITLKEIKKMLCNRPVPSKKHDIDFKQDPEASMKLIQTHSQPNLRTKTDICPGFSSTPGSPALKRESDQSFIQMEDMVSKLCISPRNSDNIELNNTLEVIDYILNHGSNHVQETKKHEHSDETKKIEVADNADLKVCSPLKINSTSKVCTTLNPGTPKVCSMKSNNPKNEDTQAKQTCLKIEKTDFSDFTNYCTPAKTVMKHDFITPASITKAKTPMFKTPANPSALKKPLTPRNTPGRSTAYQHIASPIASYIKNCPQVPLVKTVLPKKPLPGPSSIPKLVRNPSQSKIQINKENMNLPSVAYKSAKKTKVIKMPDEDKLPQCQWAKKMASSASKPTVMKHQNREMNHVKKRLLSHQEDSFENMSYLQAEISVCTEKTAFKSTNKH